MPTLTPHAILDELALICQGAWCTRDASLLYSSDLADAVLAIFPSGDHAEPPTSPSMEGVGYIYRKCCKWFPPDTWRVVPHDYHPAGTGAHMTSPLTEPLTWTTEAERNFDTNGTIVYKRARIFVRADSDSRLIQFTIDAPILKTMSREELAAILMPQILGAIEDAQKFATKNKETE